MTYADELLKKQYVGNVVIQIYGAYFSIRQPDSGLSIPSNRAKLVANLSINPTSVDLRRVNTTVGQYSFQIVDKSNVFTAFIADNTTLTGAPVRIWIGRSVNVIDGVPFPFSSYFELPQTLVKKITHADNTYQFSTAEQTDKMGRPIFNTQTTLGAAMTSGSSVIQASADVSPFYTSGLLKIDNEFMDYTSLDLLNKRFNTVTRGDFSTVPAAHERGKTIYQVYRVDENPINIFLKMLISGGGGGPYDVYPEGLGINASLIDVTGLETLRDAIFPSDIFTLYLYNIPNALSYIEQELLYPNNLRVAISADSKITLALLDQSVFGATVPIIDESTITEYPMWVVDDNVIANQVVFDWDWSEATNTYNEHSVFEDADSITNFGLRQALTVQAKGIVAAHAGMTLVTSRAFRLLQRFSTPSPQITVKTQIDKSLVNIGDKVRLDSSQIPTNFGTLNFSQELEVISRSIEELDGLCEFQLAFTSYSGFRGCYIAPSDIIIGVTNQKTVNIASGRGVQYKAGWVMRLWDIAAKAYTADPPNVIDLIAGDQIVFTANFATPLVATAYRLRFALYDEVSLDQQRYGFIAPYPSEVFPDGSGAYKILF